MRRDHAAHGTASVIRQIKSLTKILEPAHRGVTRVTRPMRGVKSGEAAQCTLAGVERMPRRKQGQRMAAEGAEGLTPAAPVYALAA
jgi:transposase-like protein